MEYRPGFGLGAEIIIMAKSTDWEARYKAGDTPWDKGLAAPPLSEIDAKYFEGRVLVPGCGFGHDVRGISRADNEIVGFDLAQSAVEGARKIPQTGSVRYVFGNFFELPEEFIGKFNAVFEHTCFCAINSQDRARYVASVVQALQPSGFLVAIFYIDPGHEEGPPFPVNHNELDNLFGTKFDLLKAWVPKVSFPGREEREEVRIYQLRA